MRSLILEGPDGGGKSTLCQTAAENYLIAVANAFDRVYLLDRLSQRSLTACSLSRDLSAVNDKRHTKKRPYSPQ